MSLKHAIHKPTLETH